LTVIRGAIPASKDRNPPKSVVALIGFRGGGYGGVALKRGL
jgi:hypothetical protein